LTGRHKKFNVTVAEKKFSTHAKMQQIHGIVAYKSTFLRPNVCEKFFQFLPSTKKMHTKRKLVPCFLHQRVVFAYEINHRYLTPPPVRCCTLVKFMNLKKCLKFIKSGFSVYAGTRADPTQVVDPVPTLQCMFLGSGLSVDSNQNVEFKTKNVGVQDGRNAESKI